MRMTTEALVTSITGLLTAAEPIPSSRAATLEAWQRRVQWSTLFAAEAEAYQLLKQVRFLVTALGGAEARQRLRAVGVADLPQASAAQGQRFFPGRLAEDLHDVVRVHDHLPSLGTSARRTSGTVRRCGCRE